jgi:hypothetical protein
VGVVVDLLAFVVNGVLVVNLVSVVYEVGPTLWFNLAILLENGGFSVNHT